MRYYLLHDHHVTVLANRPTSLPNDSVLIHSHKDFDPVRFPLVRLIDIWNILPGCDPVKRFQSRSIALKRLWAALEALPVTFARTDSKQAQLIALLRRPNGASMEDLIAFTGWQRHSVRGVLSGVIRKKLGLALSSALIGEDRIYRIAV